MRSVLCRAVRGVFDVSPCAPADLIMSWKNLSPALGCYGVFLFRRVLLASCLRHGTGEQKIVTILPPFFLWAEKFILLGKRRRSRRPGGINIETWFSQLRRIYWRRFSRLLLHTTLLSHAKYIKNDVQLKLARSEGHIGFSYPFLQQTIELEKRLALAWNKSAFEQVCEWESVNNNVFEVQRL